MPLSPRPHEAAVEMADAERDVVGDVEVDVAHLDGYGPAARHRLGQRRGRGRQRGGAAVASGAGADSTVAVAARR